MLDFCCIVDSDSGWSTDVPNEGEGTYNPLHFGNDTNSGSSQARVNLNQTSNPIDHSQLPAGEPYVGQEFESEAAALEFYYAYALRMGFGTRLRDHRTSQRDGSVVSRRLVCNKEGYRRPDNREDRMRKPKAVTRVGCRARVSFKRMKSGKWNIKGLVKEHNHPLISDQAKKPKIHQIPTNGNKVYELTRELMIERQRSASLREFINLLFKHIEEHTQGLSEKIQYVAEKVNRIEAEARWHQRNRR